MASGMTKCSAMSIKEYGGLRRRSRGYLRSNKTPAMFACFCLSSQERPGRFVLFERGLSLMMSLRIVLCGSASLFSSR